jgi:hypothetical protein
MSYINSDFDEMIRILVDHYTEIVSCISIVLGIYWAFSGYTRVSLFVPIPPQSDSSFPFIEKAGLTMVDGEVYIRYDDTRTGACVGYCKQAMAKGEKNVVGEMSIQGSLLVPSVKSHDQMGHAYDEGRYVGSFIRVSDTYGCIPLHVVEQSTHLGGNSFMTPIDFPCVASIEGGDVCFFKMDPAVWTRLGIKKANVKPVRRNKPLKAVYINPYTQKCMASNGAQVGGPVHGGVNLFSFAHTCSTTAGMSGCALMSSTNVTVGIHTHRDEVKGVNIGACIYTHMAICGLIETPGMFMKLKASIRGESDLKYEDTNLYTLQEENYLRGSKKRVHRYGRDQYKVSVDSVGGGYTLQDKAIDMMFGATHVGSYGPNDTWFLDSLADKDTRGNAFGECATLPTIAQKDFRSAPRKQGRIGPKPSEKTLELPQKKEETLDVSVESTTNPLEDQELSLLLSQMEHLIDSRSSGGFIGPRQELTSLADWNTQSQLKPNPPPLADSVKGSRAPRRRKKSSRVGAQVQELRDSTMTKSPVLLPESLAVSDRKEAQDFPGALRMRRIQSLLQKKGDTLSIRQYNEFERLLNRSMAKSTEP